MEGVSSSGVIITVKGVKQVLDSLQIPQNFNVNMAKHIQRQLLQETYNQVIKEANKQLHSTKAIYKQGLSVSSNSVDLDGTLPNMIEDGSSAWDMKTYFQNSSKAKISKHGGWYLTIPFRIHAPTAGNNVTKMSWEIYRAVSAGRKYNPGVASNRPAFRDPQTGTNYPAYQHKSPILAGINKFTNPSTGMNTFKTFRRVSNKSNPNSWIHRGFIAKKLFDRAWANVDLIGIINKSFDELVDY